MTTIKRKWSVLPKEKQKILIEKTISYFANERDQEIGIISAEEILDFFTEHLYTEIYNTAIDDSKKLLRKRSEDLEFDFDLLVNK
jgi:uncharacterized protein (DUF2164 family)